jgi:succinylglutamate desuccinylase
MQQPKNPPQRFMRRQVCFRSDRGQARQAFHRAGCVILVQVHIDVHLATPSSGTPEITARRGCVFLFADARRREV